MIEGSSFIGFERAKEGDSFRNAYSPLRAKDLPEKFHQASLDDIRSAVAKAASAYRKYSKMEPGTRATFLRGIAAQIESYGDEITKRATLETGLPEGRIEGERARTVNQLKLFASILEEGSYVEAIIDTGDPKRTPLPKPDIRKMMRPIGPVAVFTASNFPLAFSTAGGDTASALAAGNPVIVKSHPLHPGTNEIVASAIIEAAKKTGMPDGVFSSINAADINLAQQLALDEQVKAIAFTGSYKGGKSLFDLNQKRMTPIPIFSEMGSINPVVLLENKLQKEADSLAEILSGSVCLGAGQFCTNPGVIMAVKGQGLDSFVSKMTDLISGYEPVPMLSRGIYTTYHSSLESILSMPGVTRVIQSKSKDLCGAATFAKVDAATFMDNPYLKEEIFGPFTMLIEADSQEDLLKLASSVQGQLTTSIFGTEEDFKAHKDLIYQLEEICGRVIFNGVPTGVEVGYAMQHGGPFPSTTDSRFTSVGADAIKRFVRPIAWQDAPESILPVELRNSNLSKIWRKINGEQTREDVT